MSDSVKHSGIVVSVSDDSVKVRILQSSACAECSIAGHCNASDKKEKFVDVLRVNAPSGLKSGDEVVVEASRSMAAMALLLTFGVPLVILLCVLFSAVWLMKDEVRGAIIAVAALLPYYAILYLLRNKLRAKIVFSIQGK